MMKKILGLLLVSILLSVNTFEELPEESETSFLQKEDRAEFLFMQGLGFYNLSQYSKAIEYMQEALEIYTEEDDQPNIAKCYNNIGNIYNKLNLYNKAMEYHLLSLKLEEEQNDEKGIISSLNNIGNVLQNIDEFNQALQYYQNALDLSYQIKDNESIGITLNNIGNIYLTQEKFESALDYYNQSLVIKEEIADDSGIATTYNNIGMAYQGLGSTAEALKNHDISLNMMKKLKNGNGIASAYFHIGIIHFEESDFEKASFYINNALSYAKNYDNKQILLSSYKILEKIYYKQADYNKAYSTMKLYTQLKDDLFSLQTQKAVTELQIRYETEQKEKEIQLLKTNASISEYKSDVNRMLMIILVVILIAVAALGSFFYIQFRQKTQTNNLIEDQNKQLTEAYSKMEDLAKTDALTELSNRRDMYQIINHETDRFERNGKSFTILMADIDNFKRINDTYGHDVGDRVLKTIANVMKTTMRKQDIIGRWGGEEFLLLLPETDIIGGKKIAEKLRSKISKESISYSDKFIHVTVTIGVSVYNRIHDVNESIKEADEAMYLGKIRNKNCVVTSNKSNLKVKKRAML